MHKSNFHFLRFIHCSTSKHKTKQTPFDSPFYFVSTLLEPIYLEVKAAILIIRKLTFGFLAKGFTRHFSQKMASQKKKMKTSQTFYISSLMYLQSFWLRNMRLKMIFFYPFHPVHEKNSYSICMSAATTRPDETEAQTTLAT